MERSRSVLGTLTYVRNGENVTANLTPKMLALILMLLSATGVHQQQAGTITIQFQVKNFWTAEPIQGVTILLSGPSTISQTTNQDGNTTVTVPFGNYEIIVNKAPCTQIGPQNFIVDATTLKQIIAKLQCAPSGTPPLVNPHVQTDQPQYQHGQRIVWITSGFSPGAYVQPCLGQLCGSVGRSSISGTFEGTILVDQLVSTGNQTLSVRDIVTNTMTQVQVLILS
jgi:hypothetical protein